MTKDEFFSTPCTQFDCCSTNVGHRTTFGDFLSDDTHLSLIGKYRTESDPDKRKQIKTTMLPAATLAAFYPGGERGNGKPRQLTGYWCVDIDAQDNPTIEPERIKTLAMGCRQVIWCAHSLSGKGVYAIVRLAHPERYKAHFKALQRLFKERLGLVVDKSCSDAERLRIASHDLHPYFNGDAEVFAVMDDDGDAEEAHTDVASVASDPMDDLRRAELCVSEIERRGLDLCPTRAEWIECGMELNTLGDDAKQLYERISALWQAKPGKITSQKDINNAWKSFKRSGRTIGSFFHRCEQHGIPIPHSQPSEEELLHVFDGLL